MTWNLTREGLEKFLRCLDSDMTRAGEAYEKIRAKLISFFAWRGFRFPEDHADETINRVIRKIDEGEEIRDPSTYVYGVGRMLILELVKERDKKNTALESLPPSVMQGPEDDEESQIRIASLKLCLQKLSAENREMILGYYEEKGVTIETRRLLAERLQIPLNALRIRALRLRDKLEKCINRRQPHLLRGRVFSTNL